MLLVLGGLGLLFVLAGSASRGARARVLDVINRLTPADLGDARFDEILGGAPRAPGKWPLYEEGFGTTCGLYVSRVLEALGCSRRLINRGASYQIGAHISRLLDGARELRALRSGLAGIKAGDVYLVWSRPDGTDAHVGFWLGEESGGWVRTADAGQVNRAGRQAARFVRRRLRDGSLSGPDGAEPSRPVRFHIDLDAVCSGGR
jgi:hypothetical protein